MAKRTKNNSIFWIKPELHECGNFIDYQGIYELSEGVQITDIAACTIMCRLQYITLTTS